MDDQSLTSIIVLLALLGILVVILPPYVGYFLVKWKRPAWALTWYTWMIQMRFEPASAYINRSMVYLFFKEYQLALQDADAALQLNPEKAVGYNNRGAAYNGLQQYQRALEDLNRSLELRPAFPSAYRNRAYAYLHLKRFSESLQDIESILAISPMDFPALYMRTACLLYLGQYQQVIEQANDMLALKPDDAPSYHHRGVAYLSLHDLVQGKADLLKSQEINPGSNVHGAMLEWYRLGYEQPDEAMPERLEALATLTTGQPQLPYVCQGIASWLRGSYEESLRALEQAIELAPDDEEIYFWVGMVCASLGRDEEALAALTHARRLGLLPILLAPLRLLATSRPAFFAQYVQPLLAETPAQAR